MLNIFLISVIMLFCVIGIYFTVKEITSIFIKNHTPSKVIVEIDNNPEITEATLRNVLAANPASDIIVLDESDNSEIADILSKISADNSRVHIKNAPAQ